jgi:hypothetical protein
MLTNECHACENFIEFPDHGVGEQIECPHCGSPILLTDGKKTLPVSVPAGQAQLEGATTSGASNPELAQIVEQLNAHHKIGPASDQFNQPKRKLSPRTVRIGAAIGAAVVVISALTLFLLFRPPTPARKEEARQTAMAQIVQQAAAVGAPTGLLGTKWLMSMNEVTKVLPDTKQIAPGVLAQTRKFYDRDAVVTYHFTNDLLLLAMVSFTGPTTPPDFERTQARMKADYGTMPSAVPAPDYILASTKKIHHVVIRHCLSGADGAPAEQIQFFIRGGGDPKVMPKAKPAKAQPPKSGNTT